jgi:hypothetical protein
MLGRSASTDRQCVAHAPRDEPRLLLSLSNSDCLQADAHRVIDDGPPHRPPAEPPRTHATNAPPQSGLSPASEAGRASTHFSKLSRVSSLVRRSSSSCAPPARGTSSFQYAESPEHPPIIAFVVRSPKVAVHAADQRDDLERVLLAGATQGINKDPPQRGRSEELQLLIARNVRNLGEFMASRRRRRLRCAADAGDGSCGVGSDTGAVYRGL